MSVFPDGKRSLDGFCHRSLGRCFFSGVSYLKRVNPAVWYESCNTTVVCWIVVAVPSANHTADFRSMCAMFLAVRQRVNKWRQVLAACIPVSEISRILWINRRIQRLWRPYFVVRSVVWWLNWRQVRVVIYRS